ncbi:MAG: tautomerase family protein [Rhodospirillales bacterium]|nr:tautomerase family protein [Rhodospirillales bacterium]
MPLVTVEMMPGRTREQKDAFAKRVVVAMDEELGAPASSVWLVFKEVDPADWYMGEKSTAQVRREREAAATVD